MTEARMAARVLGIHQPDHLRMTEAQIIALVERLRMISNLAGRKQLLRWEARNLSDDERQRVEARIIELWRK